MRTTSFIPFALVFAVGCGSSSASSGFADAGKPTGTGNDPGNTSSPPGPGTGDSDAGGVFGTGDAGAPPADGCSDAAKLVYVLSSENDLYSFRPLDKKFTKIGRLACNTKLTPNSMAVSRDAVAWVNYVSSTNSTGQIFKVSTTDASCQPTNVQLSKSWVRLGMGFSTNAVGGSDETLFVAATTNGGTTQSDGLGKIDTASLALSPVGAFTGSLAGKSAELTGTGDARLYGFFVDEGSPLGGSSGGVQLAQIDKATGATSNVVPLTGVEVPQYWAFSFWGGDFYFYTAPGDFTRTSNVTRYRPSDGSIDTAYMENVGFHIVGAGVSTCAPTAPPK